MHNIQINSPLHVGKKDIEKMLNYSVQYLEKELQKIEKLKGTAKDTLIEDVLTVRQEDLKDDLNIYKKRLENHNKTEAIKNIYSRSIQQERF